MFCCVAWHGAVWRGVVLCAGAVLRNDVVGRIMMKCLLSDMPELRLGLNEKIEDITFHQVTQQLGPGLKAVRVCGV